MKNYSEMSDKKINVGVAFHLGLSTVILAENGQFDPCNNPSDAWPIIVENKITIIACIDSWVACPAGSVIDGDTSEPMEMMYCNSWGSATCVAGKNPLRTAMIVFLMMKDAE